MTRVPDTEDAFKLRKLAEVRELAAHARLSAAAGKRDAAAARVRDLMESTHQVKSFEDAVAVDKWRAWKKLELAHRNGELATAEAEFLEVVQACGHQIAEKAVADRIVKLALARDELERDELHLLTGDFCDQNIGNGLTRD